jgi:hypothetical protein
MKIFLSKKTLIMSKIVLFLIPPRSSEQNDPKNAKKLQADLLEIENNHQEVRLKPHVCLLSFGLHKMISGALVLGCMVCGPKLTIYDP